MTVWTGVLLTGYQTQESDIPIYLRLRGTVVERRSFAGASVRWRHLVNAYEGKAEMV